VLQVGAKVRDLCALLHSAPSPAAQLYGCLVLASKLLSQCDAQLTKLQSFAFPLATVAVRVGAAFPAFMDVLVAKLHKACMFTVGGSGGEGVGRGSGRWRAAVRRMLDAAAACGEVIVRSGAGRWGWASVLGRSCSAG
jgi:hypothetical protein